MYVAAAGNQGGYINIPSLAIGQSVEVVYQNGGGVLAVDLVTDEENIALHFNPRYNLNVLVLNTLLNGTWQDEIRPQGFPFPPNGVSTRFSVRITAQPSSFTISVNGIQFAVYPYRGLLTNEKVSTIRWRMGDEPGNPPIFESVTLIL